ncbi:unnamed protein product [Rotaria magnacalcarata]|uniref:ADP-ribosylation factor n=1 Tax=Rotaria magnacalcarata TaxID=392030 RepID=A0A815UI15_9BILA|nr:unnamed protein product [Rotaria magnacalcarata]CAF1517354.1 unnamed protein product [Rotaria magnacalcarata]CAF2027364.1 unnamed protein product [Rotaria magnacalcarata]CAF2053449.1 unnamed protein product [Rotaria magnacalcarata]CAF3818119.1 unnamed protein product [Rotaria magnacalcarata]
MGSFLSRLYDVLVLFEEEKCARILMLGLDAAGFNIEQVSPCRDVSFTVWDVAGQAKIRGVRRSCYRGTEGLIFVVDSNDPERIEEAREEFEDILKFPDMSNVPIVVIANKQDLPNAMKPSEIIPKSGMNKLHGKHKWHVQSTCAITGDGLIDATV